MSWHILITDGLAPEGIKRLEDEAIVTQGQNLPGLGQVDAIIVRSRTKVTAQVIAKGLPQLKVIGRAGVGVDNIDLEAATSSGVIVVNAPMAATIAVAEHTLGLMLALARHIPQADASLRAGVWNKGELKGTELSGKSLGIVGLGRIGSAVSQRARAMGMRVLGYDPCLDPQAIHDLGVEPTEWADLLEQSDYLSLHIPLNDQTQNMINEEALARIKPKVRIICTARGGVIDERALLTALDNGTVSGAALDVFTQEPPGLTDLIQHPKVISTPHIGAQTIEAQRRAAIDIAEETLAALHGRPLRWRVA